MNPVSVIDYGIGNLLSVCRALEHCGAEVELVHAPDAIRRSERLVLPGVGAFRDGMAGLRSRAFVEPIREFAERDRPFLGICLGMQMMFDASEEFGDHEGLGLIPGRVEAIPRTGSDGAAHKIPHIGWNALRPPAARSTWENQFLDGVEPGTYTYFVHSFTAVPTHEDHRLADCLYNGRVISAAAARGNLYGTQFHPEKSGEIGLRMIRNFLAL